MSRPLHWPLAITASGIALLGLVVADVDSPARVALALWFMLFCTGMSFAPLLSTGSAAAELTLGIALSLALDTVAATALLVAGGLSLTTGLIALEAICLTGCALQVWRSCRVRSATVVRLHG